MKEIVWEIEIISPPPAVRHCRKCGRKTAFHHSGAFRMNAQKKSLDIWLIYKCEACDSTWNMTIASRVSPAALDKALLERFQCNDEELACRYAMDIGLLTGNGVKPGTLKYEILGETIGIDCLKEPVTVVVTCRYGVNLKLYQILKEKLSLSNKGLDQLIETGKIQCEDGTDVKQRRLLGERRIRIGM